MSISLLGAMLIFLCLLDLPINKIKEKFQSIKSQSKDDQDIVKQLKEKRFQHERLKKLKEKENPTRYISDEEMLKKFLNAMNTYRPSPIAKVE